MTHALINEFVVHADAYVDLHGGDIPEALVPFSICRSGQDDVSKNSKEMAMAFGLPFVLTVSKPVQPSKGNRAGSGGLSSYAAAAEKGIPSILAEAGGVGQMQEDQVELLVNGVRKVMQHLKMLEEDREQKTEDRKAKSKVLTKFEWLYTKHAGMWYPKVAAGDEVKKGEEIGRVGDLFGDTLEKIISPVDGIVLFLTINPSVQDNGLLMGLGVE
jgi:predicted deacylase